MSELTASKNSPGKVPNGSKRAPGTRRVKRPLGRAAQRAGGGPCSPVQGLKLASGSARSRASKRGSQASRWGEGVKGRGPPVSAGSRRGAWAAPRTGPDRGRGAICAGRSDAPSCVRARAHASRLRAGRGASTWGAEGGPRRCLGLVWCPTALGLRCGHAHLCFGVASTHSMASVAAEPLGMPPDALPAAQLVPPRAMFRGLLGPSVRTGHNRVYQM